MILPELLMMVMVSWMGIFAAAAIQYSGLKDTSSSRGCWIPVFRQRSRAYSFTRLSSHTDKDAHVNSKAASPRLGLESFLVKKEKCSGCTLQIEMTGPLKLPTSTFQIIQVYGA